MGTTNCTCDSTTKNTETVCAWTEQKKNISKLSKTFKYYEKRGDKMLQNSSKICEKVKEFSTKIQQSKKPYLDWTSEDVVAFVNFRTFESQFHASFTFQISFQHLPYFQV